MDDKYRVLLNKDIREKADLTGQEELVAIPFRGGVTLLSLEGKNYKGSLTGFGFDEEKHEASEYLFGE